MPRVRVAIGDRIGGWLVTSAVGRGWAGARDLAYAVRAYAAWRRARRSASGERAGTSRERAETSGERAGTALTGDRAAAASTHDVRARPLEARPQRQPALTRGSPRTVAVLGTGTLGAPVARRLAEAGFTVRAWNRTPARAQPLAAHGVEVCASAAAAADGADALITLLSDGRAVAEVCAAGVLASAPRGALWLQMSTVGVRDCERLRELAERHDVVYCDCPVLGTREPAERGELVALASGPRAAEEPLRQLLRPLARTVLWLGEAGAGSRMKVAVNGWLLGLVANLAETIALARALDLDAQVLVELLARSPAGSPYAGIKGPAMFAREYPPSFSLALAAKDARLVREARDLVALRGELAESVRALYERALERGLGDLDFAAVYELCAPLGERTVE